MAPATNTKSTTTNPGSILDLMEKEENVTVPSRGRGFDPDVLAIRGELEKMVADGGAVRSFKGVTAEDKEVYSRKVRAAGKIKPAIKTSNRFDARTGKLYWGPAELFDKLNGKTSE